MPVNLFRPSLLPPELEYHLATCAASYDLNFVFDVPARLSTTGGISLSPLIPSLHAQELHSLLLPHPELWLHLTFGPCPTLASFLTLIERFRSDPNALVFIIHDLSSPSHPVAGIIGVLKSSLEYRLTEIGPLIILPAFQRTHVVTHACGLVLRWCFDTLGLRRVQWSANADNAASWKAGLRLGLKKEGEMRWDRVLPLHKTVESGGIPLPEWAKESETAAGRGLGRHTILLGLGWDDWRDGGSQRITELIEREVIPRR